MTRGYGVQAGVVGFKAGDRIALGVGFTAADAKAALAGAVTGAFGTTLTLGQGTSVTLFGVAVGDVRVDIG